MKGSDIIIILFALLGLCGVVIFIIFLAGIAMYESFLLVAVCVLAVIILFIAVYYLNKKDD